jgi:hypothetical protein
MLPGTLYETLSKNTVCIFHTPPPPPPTRHRTGHEATLLTYPEVSKSDETSSVNKLSLKVLSNVKVTGVESGTNQ